VGRRRRDHGSPRGAARVGRRRRRPPAGSAPAERTGRSRRFGTPARTTCPSSGSAWASRWRSSSTRATCSGWGAHSAEIDPDTPHPVIDLLPDQYETEDMGGTMRLGAHKTDIEPGGTLAARVYDADSCTERHRHRYEVNPEYIDRLEAGGLTSRAAPTTGWRSSNARTTRSSSARRRTPSSARGRTAREPAVRRPRRGRRWDRRTQPNGTRT